MIWLIFATLFSSVLFYQAKDRALKRVQTHDDKPPDTASLVGVSVLAGCVLAVIPHLIFSNISTAPAAPPAAVSLPPSTVGLPSWERAKTSAADAALDAASICGAHLKNRVGVAQRIDVPAVPNMGQGGEVYFAWGAQTQPVRIERVDGSVELASASCIVDQNAGLVKAVTLNGKTIMGQ